MTPSIPHRIDSLIQAMRDIVLPAIGPDKSLACEQAQLIVAHLHLMQRQLAQAPAFDELQLQAASRLAQKLLALESDAVELLDHRTILTVALDEAPSEASPHAATRRINAASETLVRALRAHADRGVIDAMTATVLAHAREHSLRSRVWFASNGFDSERDSLPAFESLFAVGQ